MSLVEALSDASKKDALVSDVVKLVDEEVASKGGLSGIALKAGYAAVKGVKPGFVQSVVQKLLPDFASKLDPLWIEAKKDGQPVPESNLVPEENSSAQMSESRSTPSIN